MVSRQEFFFGDLDKNVKSLHRCRAREASSSMTVGNEKNTVGGSSKQN